MTFEGAGRVGDEMQVGGFAAAQFNLAILHFCTILGRDRRGCEKFLCHEIMPTRRAVDEMEHIGLAALQCERGRTEFEVRHFDSQRLWRLAAGRPACDDREEGAEEDGTAHKYLLAL